MQSPDRAVKAVVSAPQPSFDVPTEQAECREHAAQSTGMVITRKQPPASQLDSTFSCHQVRDEIRLDDFYRLDYFYCSA